MWNLSYRGSRLNGEDGNNCFGAIRVFVWPRQSIIGNKDPGDFVIAVCELSGQLLIYDRKKFENITQAEIDLALTETCQEVFNQVRPKVIDLFQWKLSILICGDMEAKMKYKTDYTIFLYLN